MSGFVLIYFISCSDVHYQINKRKKKIKGRGGSEERVAQVTQQSTTPRFRAEINLSMGGGSVIGSVHHICLGPSPYERPCTKTSLPTWSKVKK